MKKILSIIITILTMFSCSAENKDSVELSGELNGGLRYIDVNKTSMENITVYRGDYIVFVLENGVETTFKIDKLKINEVLPKKVDETPYIKIKQSGLYSYTLGKIEGTINVLEYSGSNYQELSAEKSVELINNINPFILDVRTEGEFKSGHIPNASLLPVQILSKNIDQIEKYKNEPIFVYCQSGNRSTVASKILIDEGFTKVYNLRNGIGDWIRRGYPIIK